MSCMVAMVFHHFSLVFIGLCVVVILLIPSGGGEPCNMCIVQNVEHLSEFQAVLDL